MDTIGYFLVVFIALFLYFLPALLANGKRNAAAIFWLNLLLGWTLLGWIGALIWAMTKDQRPVVINQPAPAVKTDAAQYTRLKQLRDEGIITQDEFMQQITKLP